MDREFPTRADAGGDKPWVAPGVDGFTSADDNPPAPSSPVQMFLLSNRNFMSHTYFNVMAHISSNFQRALETSFPNDLPMLLFRVADLGRTVARLQASPTALWCLSPTTLTSTTRTRGRSRESVRAWAG